MLFGKINSVDYVIAMVKLPKKWDFPESKKCVIQLVNPKKVFGKRHVLHCILLTESAFKGNTNIASSPGLEFLIRLSGTRQINKAINRMSPKGKALVVVFGKGAMKCYEKARDTVGWTEDKGFKLESSRDEKDAMERAVLLD